MIGWTNMADGGVNIQNGKAVIHVLAPVGSTINFLKNGVAIVLKPDKSFVDIFRNDLAHWYYSVSPSNYGEWTVTASLGTDTVSNTIVINDNKEYDVELLYAFYIFKHNVGQIIAFGTSSNSNGQATITTEKIVVTNTSTSSGQVSVFTDATIDFTDYVTVHFMLYCTQDYGGNNYGLRVHVTNNKPTGTVSNPAAITRRRFGTNSNFTEITLDVSNVDGLYYLGIWGIGKWECTDIWLT